MRRLSTFVSLFLFLSVLAYGAVRPLQSEASPVVGAPRDQAIAGLASTPSSPAGPVVSAASLPSIPIPGPFSKIFPANGTTGLPTALTLTWGSSTDAVSYRYCYDTINNGSCDTAWSPVANTSAPISGLTPGTAYYWQVTALNSLQVNALATGGETEADDGLWWSFSTASSGGKADLAVTKTDAPDPVTAGGIMTYTIVLRNNGPATASSISLTDTLPASTTFRSLTKPYGWTCTTPPVGGTGTVSCTSPSLPTGISRTFKLSVFVSSGTPGGTVITNQARTSSATADPNPANNSASTTTTVAQADLSVTNTDRPDPVRAGGVFTYTIVLRNNGPTKATNLALSNAIPAGTAFRSLTKPSGWNCTVPPIGGTGNVNCTIASLSAGLTKTFKLAVTVNPGTPTGTVITDQASVTSATPDPNLANNTATATTTVSGSTQPAGYLDTSMIDDDDGDVEPSQPSIIDEDQDDSG